MLDIKLYNGCASPRYVYAKASGRVVYVECGKCAYCMAKRSRRAISRINFNARKYRYCYFCSLDFAPKHLPLMRAYVLDKEYDCENVEGHIFDDYRNNLVSFSDWRGPSDEYVTILLKQVNGTVPYDKLTHKRVRLTETFRMTPGQFRELLARVQPTNESVLPKDCIPFANYVEFQNFIKRLKVNLKRLNPSCDASISYYIVTEYGPQTLRPHCHMLLFFDSELIAQNIIQACHKSWKFGRVDCSLSSGKSISYVAGYANSYAALPLAYRASKVFRVRARSSVGFDCLDNVPCPYDEDKVQEFNDYLVNGITISSNGKSCTLCPSPTVVNAFYPRFKGYDVSDALQTARILLACKRMEKQLGFDCFTWDISSVTEYAECLYTHLKIVLQDGVMQPYLNCDEIDLALACDLVNSRGFLYTRADLEEIGVKYMDSPYDLDEFLSKRVYRLCLTVFKFFRLWHYPDFDLHSLAKFLQTYYDLENTKRYHQLAEYFSNLECNYELSKVPYHFIARYRSTCNVLTSDNCDFETSVLSRDLLQINEFVLNEKIKHKKLNDSLGIWLNKNGLL